MWRQHAQIKVLLCLISASPKATLENMWTQRRDVHSVQPDVAYAG